jgi:hypothetical protein
MRQVNPNKASRRKPNKCFHIIKTTHDFFKGSLSNLSHLRQVMLQQKLLSILSKRHQAWLEKSKPQFKQAPFCTTFFMKLFSLFQHHSNLFETTLLMKTNIDQRSKYTLMQRYKKI